MNDTTEGDIIEASCVAPVSDSQKQFFKLFMIIVLVLLVMSLFSALGALFLGKKSLETKRNLLQKQFVQSKTPVYVKYTGVVYRVTSYSRLTGEVGLKLANDTILYVPEDSIRLF